MVRTALGRGGGLTKKQIVRAAAIAGAAIGLAFDIPSGGLTLGIPTLIGAVAGAALGYYGVPEIPSPVEQSGNTINIGPTKGIEFPWIVLNRVLSIFKKYANRPHALRGDVEIEVVKAEDIVSNWTKELHGKISTSFANITKQRDAYGEAAEGLEELILEQLSAIDDGNGDETLSPDEENTT